ncbi:hypothetical protein RB623_19730 [Mesorhizobium sp. LHD-90]|uniref:relaxase/mobilization nuclease domain-containing protein n=1 Tax=Mesorhizobium sp. LHD-90 TaxID=3071414 RepID=UPI0027E00DBC|nr:hypothetical protein [Mesorhizobium sp. LHD-90]MDQ6436295.1 hypothetical protein [Mesorhizobium sp. LHD-90]
MEFLPGAFEWEWERRRAALVHEMQMGQLDRKEWDGPRKGGVARLPDEGIGGFARARRRRDGGQGGWARGGAATAGRSMRTRFAALARGSQPAVVKLASYGGGARAGAMMDYTSRGGELAVENERGERVLGKDALAGQRAEWEHLFDNRAASRDLGVFHVKIDGASLAHDADMNEQVRAILRSGFGDRRFVYTARTRSQDELNVSGVVVLRDSSGERLTGDLRAAEIVQQRYDDTDAGRDVEARFRFHGYGNGVEWSTARVRELVARNDGEVRDDTGRPIGSAEQAGHIVQKEWRKELHSRKGRDVMHLIVSARAGTDAPAFEAAVRDFLGDQFAGHRYVFAVHDPTLDPKEMTEGGKRPHIHAHAIVTMRSETGVRIETSPQVFRGWRSLMAEKAREQGIEMELTDRRELASAPAYTRNQVRPVNYRGRTEHEGTSASAQVRYNAKRTNEPVLPGTDHSRQHTAAAAEVWDDLANDRTDSRASAFAGLQKDRFEASVRNSKIDRVTASSETEASKNNTNMILLSQLVEGKEDQMQEMTRPEFVAYEQRVEAVLASVERTLDSSDRSDFDEVAAAAREVVDIRREYLEFAERQVDASAEPARRDNAGEREDNTNAQWDAAVARFGMQAVEAANEVLIEVEHYREGLDRIEAGELPQYYITSYQAGLAREVHRAAEIAVNDDNQYMREVARSDQDLQRAIELIEVARDEARSIERKGQREQHGPEGQDASGQMKGSAGGSPSVAEAELNREAVHDGRVTAEQSDSIDDPRASRPEESPQRRPDERVADRRPAAEPEIARSDPPQQHVPRLREIELEVEERHERDRDDRER